MIPKRVLRSFTASGMSLLMLLGLTLSIPLTSLAATPSWQRDGDGVSLPAKVQQGAVGGFAATVMNNGPSNISQLSVTAFFQQPYLPPAGGQDTLENPPDPYTQAPVYAAVFDTNGSEIAGACGAFSAPQICSIGALGAGQSATLVIAYQTASDSNANAGIHGWWQTSGTGSSFCTGDDNSRGDCLPFHVGPTVVSSSENFAGGFFTTGGTVATAGIGSANGTSTAITTQSGLSNLVLTVADDGDVQNEPACPPAFAPCAPLSASEIHVGDGSPSYGLIKIVVEFHKTQLTGVNFNKLTVIHIHDDGSSHEIPKQKSCSGTAVCSMFENIAGGHGRMTAYVEQNGYVKYH